MTCMEVAKLSFTATDTFPATCQDESAFVRSWINNVIHIVITAHERRFFTKVIVADTKYGFFYDLNLHHWFFYLFFDLRSLFFNWCDFLDHFFCFLFYHFDRFFDNLR